MEMPEELLSPSKMATRFRGFLPVVVDVETGGLTPAKMRYLKLRWLS